MQPHNPSLESAEPSSKKQKTKSETPFEFEKLPLNLQQHIFSFLKLREFPNTARVNKQFYRLSHSPQFWLPAFDRHIRHGAAQVRGDKSLDWNKQFQQSEKTSLSDHFQTIEVENRYKIYFRLAKENDTDALLAELDKIDTKNAKKALTKILQAIDHNGDTLCEIAAKFDNQKLLDTYFEIMTEYFMRDDVPDVIFDIDKRDKRQRTILHWAFMCKQPSERIHDLLEIGCDPHAQDELKQNALMVAAGYHNPAGISLLLDLGFNVNQINGDLGRTALIFAAESGANACINVLLENGAAIDGNADESTWHPLIQAARAGNLSSVKLLLQKGASINLADSEGETALMVAAEEGHTEIAELLLSKGADINPISEDGYTPLLHAIESGMEDTAILLIQCGADIHYVGGSINSTALDYAVYHYCTNVLNLLLDIGAPIHPAEGKFVPMPLHHAAGGNDECVRLFLQKGIHPDTRDATGTTAIMLAALRGDHSCINILADAGADINAAMPDGSTALHHAILHANIKSIIALLKHGANVNLARNDGMTPLHLTTTRYSISELNELAPYHPDLTASFTATKAELNAKFNHDNTNFRMFAALRKIPEDPIQVTPELLARILGNDKCADRLREMSVLDEEEKSRLRVF